MATARERHVLQELQDIGRFSQEGFRAALEQLVGGPEAPECACGKHAGGICCPHIGVGVADVEEIGGRYSKAFGHRERGGRVRLGWYRGRHALDDIERAKGEKLINHYLSEPVRLVGQHGFASGGLFEPAEQFGDARIWFGVLGPALFVLGCYGVRKIADDSVGDVTFWKGATDELVPAFSDEVSICIRGMGGKAESGQGGVDGIGYVEECVEQCPVEVEYNGAESYVVSLSVNICFILFA